MNGKKQLLSILFVVLLMVLTVMFITGGGDAISLKQFFRLIGKFKHPLFLIPAILCVPLAMLSEAFGLRYILKKLGQKAKVKHCAAYASADIYFSAITPSATGGQPASAYYMTQKKIPASVATITLLLNIAQYTLALLLLGAIGFCIAPDTILGANFTVRFLFFFGAAFNFCFMLACIACMVFPAPCRVIGTLGIKILCKLRILKNREKSEASFARYLEEYREGFKVILRYPSIWGVTLLTNVLQRVFMALVAMFILLADGHFGFDPSMLLANQFLISVAANSVPIPGAAGVSEYLYISVFAAVIPGHSIQTAFALLTRAITHYFNFILCGVLTLCFHVHVIKHKRRKRREELSKEDNADV